MTLYADLPGRRTRQLIADAGMLLWVALWIAAGRWTHDTVMVLANPGRWLHGAGAGFEDTMTRAADQVDDLPILADRVAAPFRTAAGAGTDLAAAGQSLISSAERLAVLAGWSTALLPIVVVGGVWLWSRLRFVRQAAAARRYLAGAGDQDLFALRALLTQPVPVLATLGPDAADAWRRRDPDVLARLADLELRRLGVRTAPQ